METKTSKHGQILKNKWIKLSWSNSQSKQINTNLDTDTQTVLCEYFKFFLFLATLNTKSRQKKILIRKNLLNKNQY